MRSGWCVYFLRDRRGNVRYVGKGKPARSQNSASSRRLDYELVAVNLSEREALDIEARLINMLAVELDNRSVPPWPSLGSGDGDPGDDLPERYPDHEFLGVYVPVSIVEAIDEYRFSRRILTRSEAVRRLLLAGLQAVDDHRAALRLPGRTKP